MSFKLEKKIFVQTADIFEKICYNGVVRILGIDYGDARMGLATCDQLGLIATPLDTFKHKSMRQAIDYAASEAARLNAELIVIGLPLNMDGSEGARASKTQAFGRVLERVSGIEVRYRDERLTSVEAESILKEGGVGFAERKQLVDSMAARLILQSYLDGIKK